MTIKQQGGIFGRNPTFNDVEVKGDLTVGGSSITSVGTIASQDANSVDIDGGAIDAVTLGTNSAVTEAQIDNININGNVISATNTDGNVTLTPNGSGVVDTAASIDFGANITGDNFSVTHVTGAIQSSDGTVNIATIAFGNYSGNDAIIDVTSRCRSGSGGVRQHYRRSAVFETGGAALSETNLDNDTGSNMTLGFSASGSVLTITLSTNIASSESFSVAIRVMGNGLGDNVTVVYS